MTADTALRLARHFRTTPELWLILQNAYDISVAEAAHDYSKIPKRVC